MSSVFSSKQGKPEVHLEIPPNSEVKLYDEAVSVLKSFSEGLALKDVSSIKYHVNTWGLSSNNWFSENMIVKMKKLGRIDYSDTINYEHRSDMCMGIEAMLTEAVSQPV